MGNNDRLSGNVNAVGSITSDTSTSTGFRVSTTQTGYKISFNAAFTEVPTVLVNVIEWDTETELNDITVGIYPDTDHVEIEFWRNNNYSNQSFSFAAFGTLT